MSAGWILLVAREFRVQARGLGIGRKRCRSAMAMAVLFCWPIVAPRNFLPLAERVHLSFVAVALACSCMCITAGLRHMASVEERRHTFDLLLQTELKPGQMVVGYFMGKILRGCYDIVPILTLLWFPVSVDCASLAEFGRVLISLGVILVESVAFVTLASVLRPEEQEGSLLALVILMGVTVWFPLGGFFCERVAGLQSWAPWLFAVSPSITVYRAFNPTGFCEAISAQLSLSALALLIFWLRLRSGMFVDYGPSRQAPTWHWVLRTTPWGVLLVLVISLAVANRPACEACLLALYPIHLTLKAIVALQSGLVLREARGGGALLTEMLTTLSPEEILDRRFREIWRQFRWAVYSLLAVHLVILIVICEQRRVPLMPEESLSLAIMVLMGAAAISVDTYALIWLGMRHGLERRSVGQAWTRSFGTVVVAPWGIAVAVAMLNSGSFLTANELTGYYLCWLIVGTVMSVKLGTSAKFVLARDLRSRVCDNLDSALF